MAANAASPEGGPVNGSIPTPPGGSSPDSHVEQFRADPDKGVRMYADAQARADRAEAALQRYDAVQPLMDRYGDQLPELVKNYEAINGNPNLVKGILHYAEHGQFPGAAPAPRDTPSYDDDSLLTREEREMREQITGLEGQVSELSSALRSMTGSLGQDSLQRNIVSASRDIGLPPEIHSRVMKSLEGEFAELERNNPAQVRGLIGPQGKQMIDRAIRQHLTNDDYAAIVDHRQSRRRNTLGSFETDGPSDVPTQGAEPIPDLSQMSPADAFRWAEANPDSHDSR